MLRRVFYVVYFNDQRLQAALDAMRFIANPREKTPAHMTVRGPYAQLYNLHRQQRTIYGTEVFAKGVSAFLCEGQNTVFIHCQSEKLREVWKKQDFEFNPHITLYDGSSRQFAAALLDKLDDIGIQFRFLIDELRPLETFKGQSSSWLRDSFDENFAEKVIGTPIKASDVDTMTDPIRISLMTRFARNLSTYSTAPQGMEANSRD